MLGVSSKVDYGIIIIADLAKANDGIFVSLSEIAESKNLSANYLAQLVLPMKEAGIIESKEGKGGGHRLRKKLNKISIADVIRAFEGEISFVPCLSGKPSCQSEAFCVSKNLWRKVQDDFVKYAESKNLEEMLS